MFQTFFKVLVPKTFQFKKKKQKKKTKKKKKKTAIHTNYMFKNNPDSVYNIPMLILSNFFYWLTTVDKKCSWV